MRHVIEGALETSESSVTMDNLTVDTTDVNVEKLTHVHAHATLTACWVNALIPSTRFLLTRLSDFHNPR